MTTHPHLEGLIRKWRDAAAVLSMSEYALKNARAETYSSCADQLEALAALPGGGVDDEMIDRAATALWGYPARNDHASRDVLRTALTAALSPTPTPHEADRNE